MKIEFFVIETGEVIPDESAMDELFVMNNVVWSDNYQTTESQEATVGFEDFITRRPELGWRNI